MKPLSREQRILKLSQSVRPLYFRDISVALGLDLKTAVQLCQKLMNEGKIKVYEEPSYETLPR